MIEAVPAPPHYAGSDDKGHAQRISWLLRVRPI
jgi:hypothetical protein